MLELQNLIGGQMRSADSDLWLDNIEPATGQPFARIPRSNAADVAAAVAAARSAFPSMVQHALRKARRLPPQMGRTGGPEQRSVDCRRVAGQWKTRFIGPCRGHSTRAEKLGVLCRGHRAFCIRRAHPGRRHAHSLHPPQAHRNRRVHLPLEPSTLSLHMEDCACFGRWQLCDCQAFRR